MGVIHDKKCEKQRPVNLDLQTIRFPITAIASILHRVSGVITFIAVGILLWLLGTSLSSRKDSSRPPTSWTASSLNLSCGHPYRAGVSRHRGNSSHVNGFWLSGRNIRSGSTLCQNLFCYHCRAFTSRRSPRMVSNASALGRNGVHDFIWSVLPLSF